MSHAFSSAQECRPVGSHTVQPGYEETKDGGCGPNATRPTEADAGVEEKADSGGDRRGRGVDRWAVPAEFSQGGTGCANVGGVDFGGAISAEARTTYKQRCETCHGATGIGDGPGAAALNPKPRDYSEKAWQAKVTDQQIKEIKAGLKWLSEQSKSETKILDELSAVAETKAVQWASTPSIWPVKGSITSRFGLRVSPFTGKKALHAGLDIGARKGTEIRSPASGKVVVAAYDGRMGKFIRIDHGYGIETTYGHLSKIHVKYGDRVQRGDLIGLVGSTGKFSTGPHLHYQVAVNDKVVDPIHYILD